MLYELCTFTGMIVLAAFVFIMSMNIYVGITNKIKEKKKIIILDQYENITDKIKKKKKIIILDQYDNITYKGIEYKIMSKKIKVKKIEHKPLKTNERQIKEKNKYYDYY